MRGGVARRKYNIYDDSSWLAPTTPVPSHAYALTPVPSNDGCPPSQDRQLVSSSPGAPLAASPLARLPPLRLLLARDEEEEVLLMAGVVEPEAPREGGVTGVRETSGSGTWGGMKDTGEGRFRNPRGGSERQTGESRRGFTHREGVEIGLHFDG